MTCWVSRLLPRKVHSLGTSRKSQRVVDCHRHHEAYGYFLPIQTRWQDNDQYGHVNNAVYYSYFDTIINHYLIRSGNFTWNEDWDVTQVKEKGAKGDSTPLLGEEKCRFLHVVLTKLQIQYQPGLGGHDSHLPGLADWTRDGHVIGRGPMGVHIQMSAGWSSLPFGYCGLTTGLLTSPMVGFMVTNRCTFHAPISFPQVPVAALAVEKVGHSSVHYRLALFPPKAMKELPSVNHWDLSDGFFFGHPKLAHFDSSACTTGSSVHVFVNPATSKPTGLPEDLREGLLRLMSPASV
ncbi:uncharacterized protein LOC103659348 [Ursus maritimus]|uniref:Uncharacterized protein LOC103659348 n=1 Tax=Ursus maritimus TaxID=29073 RepID=A0A384BR77_URSMA|nr:uncharacterized protein LOC103659348 [Ursus maritimus]